MQKSERYRGVSPTSLTNTTNSSPTTEVSKRIWRKPSQSPSTVTGSTVMPIITIPKAHSQFRKDPSPSSSHMRRHHRHSHSGSSTDTGSGSSHREVESRGGSRYRTSEEVREESEMVINAVEKPRHHHHHHHHRHKHRPRESESSSKSRY